MQEETDDVTPMDSAGTSESTSKSDTAERSRESTDSPTVPGADVPDGSTSSEATTTMEQSAAVNAAPQLRTTIVYRSSSMFQTAIAATMRADVRVICYIESGAREQFAATDASGDFENIHLTGHEAKLCEDILSDSPHKIILLDNEWSDDFLKYVLTRNEDTAPIITILAATNANDGNIIRLEPRTFRAALPCDGVISAEMIADYMFTSEFAAIYSGQKVFSVSIDDAQMFRIGLRASDSSTISTFTHIRNIIGDWRNVMEPEQIVTYGRFIANVGKRLAKDHYEQYSRIYHVFASAEMFGDIRDTPCDPLTAGEDTPIPRTIHILYVETTTPYIRAHPYDRATFTIEFYLQHPIAQDSSGPTHTMRIIMKLPAADSEFVQFARKYFAIIAQDSPIEESEDGELKTDISGEKWFAHLSFIEANCIKPATREVHEATSASPERTEATSASPEHEHSE